MDRPHKHPLVAFREANDLSQVQAAELVGITQAHWSRLETGRSHAHPKIAMRISKLTGVSVESLLNFTDNETGVNAVE